MTTTSNYGFFITSDAEARFYEWREAVAGENESNMIKIDRVLGEKADSAIAVSGVLRADGWVGDAAPFEQTLTVEGLEAEQNGSVSLAPDAGADARMAARMASLCVSGQAAGVLTVIADDEKPAVDIPVVVLLLG